MITVSNVSLTFGGQKLFSGADLKFMPGNCYGVIGANGAGKSTFLRILSGELEPTTGTVTIPAGQRLSTLKQDQFKYDAYPVLDTVIMGNQRLYDIMKEKDELYAKPDFSDADGERAAELEGEFAEMDGWNAESDAATLLTGLGLPVEMHTMLMGDLKGGEKFKVLLAQALFGNPDILLLDEPTNNLDNRSVAWLEDFLMNFPGTLIVVSHDRWFLNNICTHIVDIDFNQVKLYVGNYDFWYESSKMMQSLMNDQKKRREDKIKELQAFIQRFSSNKSKAKQATSRRKLLDQLTIVRRGQPVHDRRPGRAHARVAGKWQFAARGEDADPVVRAGTGRHEKDRLRQVQPSSQRLHRASVHVAGIEHHRQRIAGTRTRGEHIELHITTGHGAVRHPGRKAR